MFLMIKFGLVLIIYLVVIYRLMSSSKYFSKRENEAIIVGGFILSCTLSNWYFLANLALLYIAYLWKKKYGNFSRD